MTRHSVRLLLLGAWFAAYAAADQDLILDGRDALLAVRGNPVLNKLSEYQLQTAAPTTDFYLSLYTDVSGEKLCQLNTGATIQLMDRGVPYLQVVVSSTNLTVNSLMANGAQGTFASLPLTDGYVSYQLNNYTPVYQFRVINNAASCTGTSFEQRFLRISHELPLTTTGITTLQESDPPIPISGNSLRIYAPPRSQLRCSAPPGQPSSSATISGVKRIGSLTRSRPLPNLAELHINLDGISGWTLVAYPQNVAISQNSSGEVKFAASSAKMQCKKDPAGDYVEVETGVKPQMFVLDWSPAWYKPQRYVPVFCGGCRLQLVFAKPKKKP